MPPKLCPCFFPWFGFWVLFNFISVEWERQWQIFKQIWSAKLGKENMDMKTFLPLLIHPENLDLWSVRSCGPWMAGQCVTLGQKAECNCGISMNCWPGLAHFLGYSSEHWRWKEKGEVIQFHIIYVAWATTLGQPKVFLKLKTCFSKCISWHLQWRIKLQAPLEAPPRSLWPISEFACSSDGWFLPCFNLSTVLPEGLLWLQMSL